MPPLAVHQMQCETNELASVLLPMGQATIASKVQVYNSAKVGEDCTAAYANRVLPCSLVERDINSADILHTNDFGCDEAPHTPSGMKRLLRCYTDGSGVMCTAFLRGRMLYHNMTTPEIMQWRVLGVFVSVSEKDKPPGWGGRIDSVANSAVDNMPVKPAPRP